MDDLVPVSDDAQLSEDAQPATKEMTGVPSNIPEPSAAPSAVAAALGQMQKQVQDLQAEVSRLRSIDDKGEGIVDAGPGGWPWQYYKRGEDGSPMAGWVTSAPGGATPKGLRNVGALARFVSKGYKVLTAYGVAGVPTGSSRPGSRFITLLQNGGAGEFPVSQVIAYRWHMEPPIPGIIFPDYEANRHRVKHFACEDCDFEQWFLDDDRETANACFRHLRRASGDGRHGYSRKDAAQAFRDQEIKPPTGRLADEIEKEKEGGQIG